ILFLALAFPKFKAKADIPKPFVVYRSLTLSKVAAYCVVIFVGFANLFTIIEPLFKGQTMNTVWMISGPIAFTILALLIYGNGEKRMKKNS
ncbi:MAG: glutamate/gamma-aminobutyrate family transporter YjeM, partial [Bacilli bacterium]